MESEPTALEPWVLSPEGLAALTDVLLLQAETKSAWPKPPDASAQYGALCPGLRTRCRRTSFMGMSWRGSIGREGRGMLGDALSIKEAIDISTVRSNGPIRRS